MSHERGAMMGNKVNEIRGLKAKTKLDLVFKSVGLSGSRLGEFVRSNGIYLSDLESWKDQMNLALESETELKGTPRRRLEKQIARLKKELNEAHLIIDAQKKMAKIVKDEEKKDLKKKEKKSSKP
jgi:hypothetical protein